MNVQLIPTVQRSVFLAKQSTYVSFDVSLDVSGLPSGSILGFDMDFRAKRSLSQPLYDIFFPTGSVVTAVDYQTVNVAFAPSDTQLLEPGDYYWEIRLMNPSQSVDTRVPYSLYGELFLLQSL